MGAAAPCWRQVRRLPPARTRAAYLRSTGVCNTPAQTRAGCATPTPAARPWLKTHPRIAPPARK
ncbi:hypothetical protein GCM10022285_38350 [Streptomyces tunisiensis]|uniref:Uncharacterized protein n=1 Tax=Streptomyces tunisiensis TaxID=948699 RepID=A0ABP7YQI2_9ACTN